MSVDSKVSISFAPPRIGTPLLGDRPRRLCAGGEPQSDPDQGLRDRRAAQSSSTSIANDMSAPAEVAVPRALFAKILRRIDGLRLRSPPFPA
jgi:hypothetical protein